MKEIITMNWKIIDDDDDIQGIVFEKTITTNDWNEIKKARKEVFEAYKNYVIQNDFENDEHEIIIYEDDMDDIMDTDEFYAIRKEIAKMY